MVAYKDQGVGRPVVMIHGMAGTAETHFSTLFEALREYRLIAPDLRGHGASIHLPLLESGRLFHTYADDIIQLINYLELDRVDLVGYSDGAETAIIVAAQLQDRTRSLTVWGASGRVPPPAIVNVYRHPERYIPNYREFLLSLEELHGTMAAHKLLTQWSATMDELASQGGIINDDDATMITCPTSILSGDSDPFNPLYQVQQLAKRIPSAHLLVLPQAGHDLLSERPAQVVAAIKRMLIDTEDAEIL
jgi:valacyclovir hydrolase